MKVCDRCFASFEEDLAVCPECGAAFESGTVIDMTLVAIQPELARANLQRMRGEFEAAYATCLHILRRFPNNFEAHEMLGDISTESGELDQAVEWFELALDLDPSADSVQRKLRGVKERKLDRDSSETADQLGLPENETKRNFLFYAVAVVLICGCAAIAYALGQQHPRGQNLVMNSPILATKESEILPKQSPAPSPTTPNNAAIPSATSQTQSALPSEDRSLTRALQQGAAGSSVLEAIQDPRSKDLTITFQTSESEDTKRLAAEIARDALGQFSDSMQVTVRAVREGHLVYAADVTRARITETQEQGWQPGENNPDAWIPYVLTNEWPPAPQTAPAPESNQGAPAQSGSESALTNPAGAASGATGSTGMPLLAGEGGH